MIDIDLDQVEEPGPTLEFVLRDRLPRPTNRPTYGAVSLGRQRTDAARFEAPEYLEIETASGRISILTGGLPYHRRSDPRMLDSLLIVKGERAHGFRLGVGIDLQQPTAAAALEFITPPLSFFDVGPPLANGSGWLFHIDAKNVLATHWEPVVDVADPTAASFPPDELPAKGFRVRLLETAGRGGRVTLRTYRPVALRAPDRLSRRDDGRDRDRK